MQLRNELSEAVTKGAENVQTTADGMYKTTINKYCKVLFPNFTLSLHSHTNNIMAKLTNKFQGPSSDEKLIT